MSFKGFLAGITGQYDKLIAWLAILGLVASAAFLGVGLRGISKDRAEFQARIGGMRPANPVAAATDTTTYERARQKLAEPDQLPVGWTNSLVVPELRVWCVDCRQPIEYAALVCPFCQTKQPPIVKIVPDKDHDGMLNEWEEQHDLNPLDPTDAGKDADGDGFTNLEEHNAVPQTDPRDKTSHPPVIGKLVIREIISRPFKFLFSSVMTLPDGHKFALNTRDRSTYFVKLGEVIEGFTIYKFEDLKVPETRGNVTIKVDRSVLTLKKGSKTIALTRGKPGSYEDLTVVLEYTQDGSTYTVEKGGTFELLGKKYQVLTIDSGKETVVIERLSDGERFPVTGAQEVKDSPL